MTETGGFNRKKQSATNSLINASRLDFNIINHALPDLGQAEVRIVLVSGEKQRRDVQFLSIPS